MKKITQEDVKKIIEYNGEDGSFTWKKREFFTLTKPGHDATMSGGVCGYRRISVNGSSYLAHRVAWLYSYGYMPENMIDHINRDKADNRISNLREASPSCNARNKGISPKSITGITGVRRSGHSKYIATIGDHGKQIYLGTHETILEAATARWEAEKLYGYPNCNSESPSFLYIKSVLDI